MADSLPRRSEVSAAMRRIDEAFGGLEFSSIEVRWSDAVASDAPEVLEAIGQVDDLLRTEPLIGHPLSIRSMLAALPGEGNPAERMSMVALLPPPLKRAFFVPEDRLATVTFRVRDLGIARYGPVFERIEAGLQANRRRAPELSTFTSTGTAAWRWRNLYQIVVDLAMSLGSASVIIFAVLGLAFRSVRIGLISIIPNVFPVGGDRYVSGAGGAVFGGGECLRIHDLSGNCRGRHDSLSDSVPGRARRGTTATLKRFSVHSPGREPE